MPENKNTATAAPPVSPDPLAPGGGAAAERERVLGIQQAGRTLHMERQAGDMITRGIGLEAAQNALLTARAERDEADQIAGNRGAVHGGFSAEDPEQIRSAMSDALSARITRSAPSDRARPWASHSMIDLARECLTMRGITPPRQAGEVWTRVSALHTTSDFSLLLADAQNKSLRVMYEAAPSGVRAAARQTTARDFKTVHRLAAGEFPLPLLVGEHGEFTRGSMSESDETYSLATFGRIFGVSRQVIINDDLSVFMSITSKMAVAAAEFVASQLAAKVVANPLMADGEAVFSAAHGNLRSTDANVDVASVSAARVAMRAQTGLNGEIFIRADPKFIITPPTLETESEQLIAQITASTLGEVNPFSGRLSVLVEPRLPTAAWYLAADPGQIDGIEYAFLDGSEGPQVETRIGFDVDGVESKLRIDFGCGWLDFRSWQKTPTS